MALDLEPVGTSRRADEVFDRLRSRIFSGAFEPGEQLPGERELAETLRVNRASVREALKRLEFLELVEVVHGQGTFVRELGASSALQLIETLLRDRRTVSRGLMAQILEFRRDVTLRVVELAARNRSVEQLERARALLEREASEGGDPKCALEIDIEMNALLGEASGNLLYQFVTNLFTKLIRRLGPLYFNERRHAVRSWETHRQLLGTLERSDAAEARRIVGVMLEYSEAAILREVEQLQARGLIGPDAERGEP